MLNAENQNAYILVDKSGNSGMGSVVGLLKVGRKKLFLIDEAGKSNEMVPQCVLDFYVVETRQRSGCGKSLFESPPLEMMRAHMAGHDDAGDMPSWYACGCAPTRGTNVCYPSSVNERKR